MINCWVGSHKSSPRIDDKVCSSLLRFAEVCLWRTIAKQTHCHPTECNTPFLVFAEFDATGTEEAEGINMLLLAAWNACQ